MIPRHHPSEATLFAYGSGGLGEGMALACATHLAFCPECQERMHQVEAIGGALLDELPPVPLADDALTRSLARLDDPEPPMPPQLAADDDELYPQLLRSYVAQASGRWRNILPGIRRLVLLPSTRSGGKTWLLRVGPGRAIAPHGHHGQELTIVLSGSFADKSGHFAVGDFAEADGAESHRPVVDSDDDCICLIATERPLRFDGAIGKIMQPLLRI